MSVLAELMRLARAAGGARGAGGLAARGLSRSADPAAGYGAAADDAVRRGFVDPASNQSTFGEFAPRPFQRMPDEALDTAGYQATPRQGSPEWEAAGPQLGNQRRANPMTEMGEMQAMRDKLRQLRSERAMAQSPEDLADIDLEISWLMRDLGM